MGSSSSSRRPANINTNVTSPKDATLNDDLSVILKVKQTKTHSRKSTPNSHSSARRRAQNYMSSKDEEEKCLKFQHSIGTSYESQHYGNMNTTDTPTNRAYKEASTQKYDPEKHEWAMQMHNEIHPPAKPIVQFYPDMGGSTNE